MNEAVINQYNKQNQMYVENKINNEIIDSSLQKKYNKEYQQT